MKTKKMSKRFLALVFALIMCFSLTATAFAAETENMETQINASEEVANDDSGIMPHSSVSGYARKTLTKSNNIIDISCTSSGWGGMGITVKTSSASNTQVSFFGAPFGDNSIAEQISGNMSTNAEKQFHNLSHNGLSDYYLVFTIPDGVSIDVQVWIYG